MPQRETAVVKAKDGRFYKIPDAVLKQYLVKPDKLTAEEKASFSSKTNGHANGNGRGGVQVIINVAPDGNVQLGRPGSENSKAQWIYEMPTPGPTMEWGDDIDPTGGMSSAARRG
jgi:hypothetical protein